MIDKVKAYKDNGYNFKLILEHKETDINCLIKDKKYFIPEEKSKTKVGHKKWKWMNNGTELFKVPIDEIDDYLKRGFNLGCIKFKKK